MGEESPQTPEQHDATRPIPERGRQYAAITNVSFDFYLLLLDSNVRMRGGKPGEDHPCCEDHRSKDYVPN
jgi:hypothetical protein